MPECDECGSSWLYRTTIQCTGPPTHCPVCGYETGQQFEPPREDYWQ